MTEDLKRDIAAAISPALTDSGYELVDLKLARYGRSSRLQIFIDKVSGEGGDPGEGVTIDDCVRVSRLSDEIIEAEGIFEDKYTLEVSSPGIDRPLRKRHDFLRKIGRTIEVEFTAPKRKPLRGSLEEVSDTTITVKAEKGTETVELEDIEVAREYI